MDLKRVGKKSVQIFKIRNRKGYAAVCEGHLTEGRSPAEAHDRMVKAVSRTMRKAKRIKK